MIQGIIKTFLYAHHSPLCPTLFTTSWNSPGQNTEVGSHSFLQGILPTQGWNPGLPLCRQILYQLSHQGSPRILEWVAYLFSRGSSWPRNWTGVSCIAGRFFTYWATREAQRKAMPKNVQTTVQLHSFHTLAKMLKILQARLQQYMNWELPDVQAGFRKGRGTRDHIANIRLIIKKAREFQKNIYFCFINYAKASDCVDHNKSRKFFKRWEYQTTWPALWEICM